MNADPLRMFSAVSAPASVVVAILSGTFGGARLIDPRPAAERSGSPHRPHVVHSLCDAKRAPALKPTPVAYPVDVRLGEPPG